MSLFDLETVKSKKEKQDNISSREAERKMEELAYVFTDRIVLHRSPWASSLPDWVRGHIITERLIALMKGEAGMATDAEAMAYIYPASMDAPLDHDWSEIYLYVATRTMELAGKTIPANVRVDSLDSYRMGMLNHLKRWIYERRVKHRPKKEREVKSEEKDTRLTKQPVVTDEAMPLFAEM